MKVAMHEKLPAIKLTWDLVVWISGGIAIAFGWFVRWYMLDVKSDIQDVKQCVNDLKTDTRQDIKHAHKRIDGVVGKCSRCEHT